MEVTKYILRNSKEDTYFLSVRLNQDPLERYFVSSSRQGADVTRTLQLYNAAALRVQRSVVLDPVRGNCSRKRRLIIDKEIVIDDTPYAREKDISVATQISY